MSDDKLDAAEADRVAAEIGRVEAEEERVDAEAGDGGRALELGRVQAEEQRVAAEAVREEQENRRRINEGGPDNNVEGEPPGTTGRVEAEEKRESAARLAYLRMATLVAIPVVLVSMIPWGVAYVLLDRADQRLSREILKRCEDSAVNRNAIRLTVIEGLPTLGYRYDPDTGKIVPAGEPTVSYYATHERERAEALARSESALQRFPAIDC